MIDRPILFSGPMVRAILDGRKTQTRRVLKPQPVIPFSTFSDHILDEPDTVIGPDGFSVIKAGKERRIKIPYAPGDRLWVREAWRTVIAYEDLAPSEMGGEEPIKYEANGAWETHGWCDYGRPGRYRQGMHMPRWASRLTLTVTDVRVQQVQEISDEDAIAEAVLEAEAFRDLWDSLNAARGFGWDQNPWVVAISFSAESANIDQKDAPT